ncbi:MAG: tyrosine phosphatase family protein [Hyphomicrobiaceae bacterium]
MSRQAGEAGHRGGIAREGSGSDAVHVCSLLDVHGVLEATRARYLVTIINEQMMLATPHFLDANNHLKIACNDICGPTPGLSPPTRLQVEDLIRFAHRWNRQGPLVVHCWAGISRSTAAAFIILCTLNPETPEEFIARGIRSASRTASPNRLLVGLGDDLLGRGGRMLAALETIADRDDATDVAQPFRLKSLYL